MDFFARRMCFWCGTSFASCCAYEDPVYEADVACADLFYIFKRRRSWHEVAGLQACRDLDGRVRVCISWFAQDFGILLIQCSRMAALHDRLVHRLGHRNWRIRCEVRSRCYLVHTTKHLMSCPTRVYMLGVFAAQALC